MDKRTFIGLAFIFLASVAGGYAGKAISGQPKHMKELTFTCDTDEECAALPPCALKPGCDGGPDSEPYRLVGYDCVGATQPLYGDEEDEFPKCRVIKRIWQ